MLALHQPEWRKTNMGKQPDQNSTFQMNIYHEAMAALLFKSTFWDRYQRIVAKATWPTPCIRKQGNRELASLGDLNHKLAALILWLNINLLIY